MSPAQQRALDAARAAEAWAKDGKPLKWRVENSWGADKGKGGYWHLYDSWFDKYVQVIVVHKKYIPEKTLALFDTRPELLPPWDPMFKMLTMEE